MQKISCSAVLMAAALIPACVEAADPQTTLAAPAPEGKLALKVETVAEGLVNPWAIAFLPDGSMLVTEREGRLRVIRNGALVEAPVANTPAPFVANQAGFFDVEAHPDFANNRTIFLSYATGTASANATRVISAEFDGAALSNIKTVYEAKPLKKGGVHFGGRLAFPGDGTMLITLGDGFDYREDAQKLGSALGKIVHVRLDGSVPDNNPFTDKQGALPEIWSYGHRNVQGIVIDGAGKVYAHEHGPQGGDEINIIAPGKNYGWPIACYCVDYSGAKVTPFWQYKGTEQPFKHWTPSIAPSGFAIYRGDKFPAEWQGDLVVGAMKAGSESLHRIDLDASGKEVGEERYLVGQRVREVAIGPDGAIYVTTEDRRGAPVGKVLRITRQ
jgi:glucose/arabinose dehydrogenase